jgi:putative resolvase
MNENEVIKAGFISAEKARRILGVTDNTLRKWEVEGKIETTRAPGKYTHRKYNVKKFVEGMKPAGEEGPTNIRRGIIYSRVSTRGQSENLKRQSEMLREKYPNYELIEDIGSGINFKRKGLRTILEFAFKNQLQEIVVTHKDRLCRFGFDLFEFVFTELSNAKIVVLDVRETSPNEELVEDILSVVTVFSAKINGRKRYGKRKANTKDVKVQDLSNIKAEDDYIEVGGS